MCSTQNFHGYSLESPHRTSLIREAQLPPAQSHTACAVTHSAAATSEPSSRISTITCASEMDLLRPARVLISFTSKPTHLGGGTWARGDTLALRGRSQYGELSKVALSSYKKKKERERKNQVLCFHKHKICNMADGLYSPFSEDMLTCYISHSYPGTKVKHEQSVFICLF